MAGEIESIEAALTALEEALEPFTAAVTLKNQPLADVDPTAPAKPPPPASSTAHIDETLETPIEVLRVRLGEL